MWYAGGVARAGWIAAAGAAALGAWGVASWPRAAVGWYGLRLRIGSRAAQADIVESLCGDEPWKDAVRREVFAVEPGAIAATAEARDTAGGGGIAVRLTLRNRGRRTIFLVAPVLLLGYASATRGPALVCLAPGEDLSLEGSLASRRVPRVAQVHWANAAVTRGADARETPEFVFLEDGEAAERAPPRAVAVPIRREERR